MPYGWTKQEMMSGFDLESEYLHNKIKLLYHTEVEGDIYGGDGETYQTKQPRTYDNQASRCNKQGEESTATIGFDKVRDGKRKNKNAR